MMEQYRSSSYFGHANKWGPGGSVSSPLLDSLKLVNGNTEYHFVLYMYVYMYPTKKNCMYVCTYVCIFGVQMNPTATSKFIFLHLWKKNMGSILENT